VPEFTRRKGRHEEQKRRTIVNEAELLSRYNYDAFVPEKFEPWMNFGQSPQLGKSGPDFPLWTLDGVESSLGQVLQQHAYTIVEFGSFT
jgi:hypothetical protein